MFRYKLLFYYLMLPLISVPKRRINLYGIYNKNNWQLTIVFEYTGIMQKGGGGVWSAT